MISEENVSALKILHDKLIDLDWRLIGSANLTLQGIDIIAKDIDIMVKVDNVQVVQTLLQQYCTKRIEYSKTGNFASYYGQFNINDVKIDVIAGLVLIKNGVQTTKDIFAKNPTIIDVEGMAIPCANLNTEYEAYIDLGRYDKAQLIKKSINI
jgi:hypothetical protein